VLGAPDPRHRTPASRSVAAVQREWSPSSERAGVTAVLDEQRAALIRKVTGVSEADARLQPTASSLALLSLIKHCAVWETRWLGGVAAGQQLPDGWPEVDEDDVEFLLREDDTLGLWLGRYEAACDASPGDRRLRTARRPRGAAGSAWRQSHMMTGPRHIIAAAPDL